MTRPRLVFVSPRFLFPTDSGGKIRTTQILRGLKGGAFEVVLLMPSTAGEANAWRSRIERCCDEFVTWRPAETTAFGAKARRAMLAMSSLPIAVASDADPAGAAKVADALSADADICVFDFPHSAVLAPPTIPVPSVMFTHNVEAEIFQRHCQVARGPMRWVWQDQYRKMRKFERRILRDFDVVIAVSDRDCAFFRNEYGVDSCGSIPTGVDTEFFEYREPVRSKEVVFCGSMDWMANIDGMTYFADAIWPLIRRSEPEARMKVVGRSPPSALATRLESSGAGWTFTGFVDDVRDHVPGSAAFVIPLRVGGGTRIKAFEGMAMGTPVVSTAIGIEGLPVTDGEHFLLADTPERFAEQVVALIRDRDLRCAVSRHARALIETEFDFRRAAAEFERHCLGALGQAFGAVAEGGQ